MSHHKLNVLPLCILLDLLFLSLTLNAQDTCDVRIIDELFSDGAYQSINEAAQAGSWILYSQYDAVTGTELWRTTGLPGDEELLMDIFPGINSSAPENFYALDANTVVFYANHPEYGIELWKSDGTVAGTELVKDIDPGISPSLPGAFGISAFSRPIDGYIYFTACTSDNGCDLWRTDGTEVGTSLVEDIHDPEPFYFEYYIPLEIYELNQGMVMWILDEITQLWISDGTPFGTYMIDQDVSEVTEHLGRLYYRTDDSQQTLHVTDGSPAGTQVLNEVGENFKTFSFKGDLYVDLSTADTLKVLDTLTNLLNPVMPVNIASVKGITDNHFFFTNNTDSLGIELWISDGSPIGTQLVKDINPGATTTRFITRPAETLFNGQLIFQANDNIHGYELWKSDGTEAGTQMIKDITPGPDYNDVNEYFKTTTRLYFTNDFGLFVTNGTELGTFQIDEADGLDISEIGNIRVLNDILYFTAVVEGFGHQLIRTNGTLAGTRVITRAEELLNGINWYAASPVFQAYRYATTLDEIYKINSDTIIHLGIQLPGIVNEFVHIGDRLYLDFIDWDFSIDHEIQFLDDNDQLIEMDFIPKDIYDIFSLDTLLVTYAVDSIVGAHFVISDGSPGGTYSLDNNGEGWQNMNNFVPAGDHFYFKASLSENGSELWISDGTEAGTQLVKDICPGECSGNPYQLYPIGDQLFFTAFDSLNGQELWVTDGTEVGTRIVKDIDVGTDDSNPALIGFQSFRRVETDSIIFFKADDGINGPEIWRSNGTEQGTYPLEEDYFFGLSELTVSEHHYDHISKSLYLSVYTAGNHPTEVVKINVPTGEIVDVEWPDIAEFWSSEGGMYCTFYDNGGWVISQMDTDKDSLLRIDTVFSRRFSPRIMQSYQAPEDSLMFIRHDDIILGHQLYTIPCNLLGNDCPESSIVTGVINNDQMVQASDLVELNAIVHSPAVLQVKSGIQIQITDPFQIDIGAILDAIMEDCNSN